MKRHERSMWCSKNKETMGNPNKELNTKLSVAIVRAIYQKIVILPFSSFSSRTEKIRAGKVAILANT